jgi:hypothetical protein
VREGGKGSEKGIRSKGGRGVKERERTEMGLRVRRERGRSEVKTGRSEKRVGEQMK